MDDMDCVVDIVPECDEGADRDLHSTQEKATGDCAMDLTDNVPRPSENKESLGGDDHTAGAASDDSLASPESAPVEGSRPETTIVKPDITATPMETRKVDSSKWTNVKHGRKSIEYQQNHGELWCMCDVPSYVHFDIKLMPNVTPQALQCALYDDFRGRFEESDIFREADAETVICHWVQRLLEGRFSCQDWHHSAHKTPSHLKTQLETLDTLLFNSMSRQSMLIYPAHKGLKCWFRRKPTITKRQLFEAMTRLPRICRFEFVAHLQRFMLIARAHQFKHWLAYFSPFQAEVNQLRRELANEIAAASSVKSKLALAREKHINSTRCAVTIDEFSAEKAIRKEASLWFDDEYPEIMEHFVQQGNTVTASAMVCDLYNEVSRAWCSKIAKLSNLFGFDQSSDTAPAADLEKFKGIQEAMRLRQRDMSLVSSDYLQSVHKCWPCPCPVERSGRQCVLCRVIAFSQRLVLSGFLVQEAIAGAKFDETVHRSRDGGTGDEIVVDSCVWPMVVKSPQDGHVNCISKAVVTVRRVAVDH